MTIRDTFHNLRQNAAAVYRPCCRFFCVFHNVAGGLYIYFINNMGDGSPQNGNWRWGLWRRCCHPVALMLTRRMQKRSCL